MCTVRREILYCKNLNTGAHSRWVRMKVAIFYKMPFYTYITTNPSRTTFYIGYTSDLHRRLQEHFQARGMPEHFASKFFCHNLVWFETYDNPTDAIRREKQIKNWRRAKKLILIKRTNPTWKWLNELI
ncbi:MAG: GIY-YIG nuclease family protein [Bacteroidota bacterium]